MTLLPYTNNSGLDKATQTVDFLIYQYISQYVVILSRWLNRALVAQIWHEHLYLTQGSRETPKRVIRKLCRPRSDAAEGGV